MAEFGRIFTLSHVRFLWILEKDVDETNLALLILILLHFPAMHFKCGIFLLMFVGGIGYCKYLTRQHAHECTQRARSHVDTRTHSTEHIHARTQYVRRSHTWTGAYSRSCFLIIEMLSGVFKIFNCLCCCLCSVMLVLHRCRYGLPTSWLCRQEKPDKWQTELSLYWTLT